MSAHPMIWWTLMIGLLLVCPSCGDGSGDRAPISLKSAQVFTDTGALELSRAAAQGDTQRIDELLAKGVNVNHAGEHGITPLWWSVVSYNYKGFHHLLEKGADPNIKTRDGWGSVIEWAAQVDDSRFLKDALAKGGDADLGTSNAGRSPLFSAILSDRTENVKILIDAGANLNFQDAGGQTPGITAAKLEDYEKAHLILEAGADPTIKDRLGRTLKSIVIEKGQNDPYGQKILKLIEKWEAKNPHDGKDEEKGEGDGSEPSK